MSKTWNSVADIMPAPSVFIELWLDKPQTIPEGTIALGAHDGLTWRVKDPLDAGDLAQNRAEVTHWRPIRSPKQEAADLAQTPGDLVDEAMRLRLSVGDSPDSVTRVFGAVAADLEAVTRMLADHLNVEMPPRVARTETPGGHEAPCAGGFVGRWRENDDRTTTPQRQCIVWAKPANSDAEYPTVVWPALDGQWQTYDGELVRDVIWWSPVWPPANLPWPEGPRAVISAPDMPVPEILPLPVKEQPVDWKPAAKSLPEDRRSQYLVWMQNDKGLNGPAVAWLGHVDGHWTDDNGNALYDITHWAPINDPRLGDYEAALAEGALAADTLGRMAYMAKVGLEMNPYRADPSNSSRWATGWMLAAAGG